jgi:hypothetical protein
MRLRAVVTAAGALSGAGGARQLSRTWLGTDRERARADLRAEAVAAPASRDHAEVPLHRSVAPIAAGRGRLAAPTRAPLVGLRGVLAAASALSGAGGARQLSRTWLGTDRGRARADLRAEAVAAPASRDHAEVPLHRSVAPIAAGPGRLAAPTRALRCPALAARASNARQGTLKARTHLARDRSTTSVRGRPSCVRRDRALLAGAQRRATVNTRRDGPPPSTTCNRSRAPVPAAASSGRSRRCAGA